MTKCDILKNSTGIRILETNAFKMIRIGERITAAGTAKPREIAVPRQADDKQPCAAQSNRSGGIGNMRMNKGEEARRERHGAQRFAEMG